MTKKNTKKVAVKVAKVVAKKVIKETKEVVAPLAKAEKAKSVLVEPAREYTKSEVRSILGLSKNTHMTEDKGYVGFEGRGKILGEAIIAFLPKSKKVKIGRKYPSGKVSVVAR